MTIVPSPAAELTCSEPPTASSRSCIPWIPVPGVCLCGSKPTPSSLHLEIQRAVGRPQPELDPDACAYFATFCMASRTQKYTVASVSAG